MSWWVEIDEKAYVNASAAYLKGDWHINTGHPMLIKLLFAGSMLLFGSDGIFLNLFPWLPPNLGALRLVSVVLSTATCLVIYYLVREITESNLVAMIPFVLLVFDPLSVGVSSYGILDPGMTCFYLASIFFFYRYIKRDSRLDFFSAAVFYGLSVASKYFALIGIFVFVGIILWKRRFRKEWKSLGVFLCIAVIIFFAVQPYYWSNRVDNTHALSLVDSAVRAHNKHLIQGHAVKEPGNPFLIPTTEFHEGPWPYYRSNPVASKPDFWASKSQAIKSPWWYILYIQTMYCTPFQLLIYPWAFITMIRTIAKSKTSDLTRMGMLIVVIPTLLFAFLSVRLPQYAILSSTSFTILGSTFFLGFNLKKRKKCYFLIFLTVFHIGWVLYALLTGDQFTGWGVFLTPLTSLMAYIFQLLWILESNIFIKTLILL